MVRMFLLKKLMDQIFKTNTAMPAEEVAMAYKSVASGKGVQGDEVRSGLEASLSLERKQGKRPYHGLLSGSRT